MTTCAEWVAELAELRAAEKEYLLGKRVKTMRAGEKQKDRDAFNYPALQRRIDLVQGKVDACNGTSSTRRRAIVTIPLDS